MDKEKEKFAFRIFRQLHGNIPDAIDSESPDFIINSDGESTGIELTELMEEDSGPFSLPAKYSLEDKIAASAREIFDLDSDRKIIANFQIADNLKLSTNKIDQLAREIANILITTTREYANILTNHIEISEGLPKGISNIYFDITPFMSESHFSIMRGKWTGSFNLNDLNRVINKKNYNIPIYRKKVNRIYLLIIEGFPPNSYLGNFVMSGSTIENNFDKIFLLKIMSRQLFEIK